MKIVADQQIPLVAEAFGQFGDVHLFPGREISPEHLRDCNILLVRSVTPVNEELLKGQHVQFVASSTSGIDHVDTAFLEDSGIGFAYAPGCNARSVAEYVLSALFHIAQQENFSLAGASAGIIGYGHVGSRVARFLSSLGVKCVINDPPLAEKGGSNSIYCSLDEALECDIVSLHVPLTMDTAHPTRDLIGREEIGRLRDGAILVNTSRGEVIDEFALAEAISERGARAIIDVWRNEPGIDTGLLGRVSIGTPHIAGYSLDGRYRAADRIYAECCAFFGEPARYRFPDLPVNEIELLPGETEAERVIAGLVQQAFPVSRDAESLNNLLTIDDARARAACFDGLRRNYPARREFTGVRIAGEGLSDDLALSLESLGFQV